MSPDNYYSILGIETDATADMIKRAYRRLSLELHPDRTKDNQILTEKYKKVNEAYGVLNDKDKKRIYDLQNIQNVKNMRNMRTNNDFKTENFMDMLNRAGINNTRVSNVNSNVFDLNGAMNDMLNNKNNIFNSEKFNNMMSKPPPIIKKISITLQEAFTGCKKPIEIERWICANTIKHNEKETLYLSIHSGIDSNEMIFIREKGNILDDFNKGDVKIFINIINNTCFKREGMDLIFNKDISLKDALCGFTFEIDYLDDRIFKIDNHNGNVISSNYKKTIKNLGMTRDKVKGNLIICFNVLFPKKLSKDIIEKLENIL
tara:strand:+ start:838 stop:1788 length:951 start_codon:yes stop_codon:yes gene_type:complete